MPVLWPAGAALVAAGVPALTNKGDNGDNGNNKRWLVLRTQESAPQALLRPFSVPDNFPERKQHREQAAVELFRCRPPLGCRALSGICWPCGGRICRLMMIGFLSVATAAVEGGRA